MTQPMFNIEMLPALHGDALFIEYGDRSAPRRLLIDGGPIGAYEALEARIKAMPAGDQRLELIVMSHVDADHVEGILRLLANKPLPMNVKDVWFNGWRHLQAAEGVLGPLQGEFLSALLVRRLSSEAWNGAFEGKAVVVEKNAALPEITIEGGLKLTLLSPTPETLKKMKIVWEDEVDPTMQPGDLEAAWRRLATQKRFLPDQGLLGASAQLDVLIQKQLKIDDSVANGSSIAFLAELGSKSCLFLADAHYDVIAGSLKRLLDRRGQQILKVDAVKVSHHGSAGNVSDDLLGLVESPRFLFSTNGAKFHHPDKDAVLRIVSGSRTKPATLFFNYKSETTSPWEDAKLQSALNYRAQYNPNEKEPFVIEL